MEPYTQTCGELEQCQKLLFDASEACAEVVEEGNKQLRADAPGVFPDYAIPAKEFLEKYQAYKGACNAGTEAPSR